MKNCCSRINTIAISVFIALILIGLYFRSVYYIDIPAGQRVVLLKSGGGAGNQLFRVAGAYGLAKRLQAQLWVVSYDNDITGRPFVLNQFNIPYDKLISAQQHQYLKKRFGFIKVNERNFYDVEKSNGQFFSAAGDFESPMFFQNIDEEVRKIELKHKTVQLINAPLTSESVAVHIRHGDFDKDRVIPITFQVQAMQKMKDILHNPHFFVFSDDVEFIRKAFANMKDVTIVSQPNMNTLSEFQLMTQCNHMIVANSTFSWWAAYLITNPHKIIIAPQLAAPFMPFNKQQLSNNSVYPTSWVQINPFELKINA